MPAEAADEVLLDTSVLVNFLVVRRIDLLRDHLHYRFAVTDHVRAEITEHYADQLAQLENALAVGWLREIPVTGPEELELFAELSASGRLGAGECSAMAVAVCRKLPLAIDDKAARKRASAFNPAVKVLDTETLMVSLIREDRMSVAEADEIKDEWEKEHRFKLGFGSFADRI
jgi:hypothetical protein